MRARSGQKATDMEAIAKALGVSKTTVHYALRNKGRVSEATRKRVLKVAAEMGYRPNLLARSLRTQRTDTVGVVLVTLTSSYHAHLLEGIDGIAQAFEHSILVACSYRSAAKERQLVEVLLEKGVDGLIVAPADPDENADYYRRLVEDGVHLVFVDRYIPGVNVDSVSTDNLTGAYRAVEHLAALGRKRIAVLTTISGERRSTSVEARIAGCARALQEAGLEPAIVLGPDVPDKLPEEEFAYDSVREHLRSSRKRFDAVFAMHDGLAYGAIEAILESGLRVPEDVAVVGFDDQDPSAYIHPPLTTVRQPARSSGEEAVRILFRRLRDPEMPPPRQRVSLEPELIVRKSCGAALAREKTA